ncbi:DUF5107 domain-containing protein [Cohnella hashimotonis]|uniref:DUF5107 domain-containing protein n=1 Tax=Cohnella hashimotonis TaxID=2826895 RepID=A0ABT6TL96_9BACL|nr:DUF5107 domain-containing protein [Cohnella hashimotonis]MDI4647033.1 DUF5107 domain-containing protein [Cohnella hashimotonis]
MSAVRVYRSELAIPTYGLLEEDINPILDKRLDPYPYPMQNAMKREKEEVLYEAVHLENDYLHLIVLPELGGRLYSMLDKRSGEEALYRNPVIRPRMIGTRGAWFAGGMEFNFPISHSPTTMSRVDCQTRGNEDGSASVLIGGIEQMSFMHWQVELRLHPGQARLEQRVTLRNPTAMEHKYYFWTNTAVAYDDSVRLAYPFDWCVNLDDRYAKWPYYKEIDCRLPQQIPYAYETFGKGMTGDSFGAYNANKDAGLVHVADRRKLKGAKFFVWGNDDKAKAWNRALTESEDQYIEVQSGPYESQNVYKFLKPHSELQWTEYWYPIFGTGGFHQASEVVAIRWSPGQAEAVLVLSATEALPGCRLVLGRRDAARELAVDLSAEYPTTVTVPGDWSAPAGGLRLLLTCGQRLLLDIDGDPACDEEYPDHDLYEDARVTVLQDESASVLKRAQWSESLGLTADAIALYGERLAIRPDCQESLLRLGLLNLKSFRYERAADCFEQLLRDNNRNGWARYYLAVTERERGNTRRAQRLFADIGADAESFDAALTELAGMDIAAGRFADAMAACALLPEDNAEGRLLAAIARRLALADTGAAPAGERRTSLPDNAQGLAERYLAVGSDAARESLFELTRGEEASLIPIALIYAELGLAADAASLLKLVRRPGMKTRLAEGLLRLTGAGDTALLLEALRTDSLDRVFLNERPLLKALERVRPLDTVGIADYLLGIACYAAGDRERGAELLLSAYRKGLRLTALLYSIGYARLAALGDLPGAAAVLEEDVAVNGGRNEGTLCLLDDIYRQRGDLAARLALLPMMEQAGNRTLVVVRMVDLLREAGQEERALELLRAEPFENWEGEEISGPCYRDTVLSLVRKALANGDIAAAADWADRIDRYPDNLVYGEPIYLSRSEVNCVRGQVSAALGRGEEAASYWLDGYRELSREEIPKTERSRHYSLQCLAELRRFRP